MVVGGVENGLGLGLVAGGWRGWQLCWLAKQWCCVVVVAAAVVGVRRLGFKIWGFLIFFFSTVDLVWRGMGYPGKLYDSHRIVLIPIDGARHSGSGID